MARRGNRETRYDRLSKEQLEYLQSTPADVVYKAKLGSFTGPEENHPFFKTQFARLEKLVDGWAMKDFWLLTFVHYSNCPDRNHKRAYENCVSVLDNSFFRFIRESHGKDLVLGDINAEYIESFIHWLRKQTVKKNGIERPRSLNTNRRHLEIVRLLFQELNDNPVAGWVIPPMSIFPMGAFEGAHGSTNPTPVLSDPEWEAWVRAVSVEALEIKSQVEADWRVLDGPEIFPDYSKKGRGMYKQRGAALWALKKLFPTGVIPPRTSIREINAPLGDAMQHHNYEHLTCSFGPCVVHILPFVLLLGIYTHGNTGSIRSIKERNIRFEEIMGVMRNVWAFTLNEDDAKPENDVKQRIGFELVKPRIHGSYVRSFQVDPSDPLSPSSLHQFITKWTERIRPYAQQYQEQFFIFRLKKQTDIRGFLTVGVDGRDSDSSWLHALKNLTKKHSLPHVTMQIIRTTGLNRVNILFGGDLIPVRIAAGHEDTSSTANTHYTGYAAKLRRDERLVEVVHTMPRAAKSKGKSSTRGAPESSDVSSATPGCRCADPFDSPIPGEVRGTVCSAHGQCPACALGSLDTRSPYALARALQLVQEIDQAHGYLPFKRWSLVYAPVKEKLLNVWLPLFQDAKVIALARALNLGPIGRLE